MNIERLTVRNFRGWEEKTFQFHPHFNVAIGNNGTGKSTLLHALQVATGAYFLGLKGIYRRHIHTSEVRLVHNAQTSYYDECLPVMVEAEGSLSTEGPAVWRRMLHNASGATTFNRHDVGPIKAAAERAVASLASPNRESLPVIAYYGVRHLGKRKRVMHDRRRNRILLRDGYYNALGEESDDYPIVDWLHNYDELLIRGLEKPGIRDAVLEAIQTAIPQLSDLQYNRIYWQFEANCDYGDGQAPRLTHTLMSDGMKRMIGIVSDIAYRCATLNGHLGAEAVRQSKGVVMIDELDMHLHPNWQRNVAAHLQEAFPNIQFIATTHSAFLLQSLQADQVILLRDGPRPEEDPVDLNLHKVALEWMNVMNPRSDNFEQRFAIAQSALATIASQGESLTMSHYARLKAIIDGVVVEETDDPVYQAYLQATQQP